MQLHKNNLASRSFILNTLLNITSRLCENLANLICSYLILIIDEINFNQSIQGIFTYKNKLYITLRNMGNENTMFYCISEERFTKKNETKDIQSRSHSNWIKDNCYYLYERKQRKMTISIDQNNRIQITRKITNENRKDTKTMTWPIYPSQIYPYEINKNILHFVFSSAFNMKQKKGERLYCFTDKDEIFKLPLTTKFWMSWCIWKHFVVTDTFESGLICYDLHTSNFLNVSLYFNEVKEDESLSIYIPKLLLCKKEKLYIAKGTDLYIYV